MRNKWMELTWPQRVMLLLQPFLIVLFLILYCTLGRQQVMWYDDAPLRYRTDGELTTFSGRVDGQDAVFTVSPGPVVEYRRGDTLYGPYTIVSDPIAVPTLEDWSPEELEGVEIRDGSKVLFRGAYARSYMEGVYTYVFPIYDENGDFPDANISFSISDPSPSVRDILQVALAPQIVQRGHFGMFWLGALCCASCACLILFADALFRFNLRFRIRNAEDAKPSEWELFSRWISWIMLTIMALVLFSLGLTSPIS